MKKKALTLCLMGSALVVVPLLTYAKMQICSYRSGGAYSQTEISWVSDGSCCGSASAGSALITHTWTIDGITVSGGAYTTIENAQWLSHCPSNAQ